MKIRDVRDRDGDRDRDRDRYADTDRVIEIDRDGERERERVDENAEFDRWVVKRSNGGWGGGAKPRGYHEPQDSQFSRRHYIYLGHK
jgi:hypothetical protein